MARGSADAGRLGWATPAPAGPLVAADHLDGDLALPGAVELGEDAGLEPPETQLTIVDGHRDTAAQEGRPEVRLGVAPLAVGVAGIVVTIARPLGHEALHERLQILDERGLELVDEERARGVLG